MREFSSQLLDGSIDKPRLNDVFSKVTGKDRNENGDAYLYGLGVCASDVWGVIPSRSACRRENIQLKSRCEELSQKVTQLTAEKNASTNGSNVPTVTTNGSKTIWVICHNYRCCWCIYRMTLSFHFGGS